MSRLSEEAIIKEEDNLEKFDEFQKELNKTDDELNKFLSKKTRKKVTKVDDNQLDFFDKIYHQGQGIKSQIEKTKEEIIEDHSDIYNYDDIVNHFYLDLVDQKPRSFYYEENDFNFSVDERKIDYNVEDEKIDKLLTTIQDYIKIIKDKKDDNYYRYFSLTLTLKGIKKAKIKYNYLLEKYNKLLAKEEIDNIAIGKLEEYLTFCNAEVDAIEKYFEYLKSKNNDVLGEKTESDELVFNSDEKEILDKIKNLLDDTELDIDIKNELIGINDNYINSIKQKRNTENSIKTIEKRKITHPQESAETREAILEESMELNLINQRIVELSKKVEEINKRVKNERPR